MKRFVKHFYAWWTDQDYEDQINNYAETHNLMIVTIAPMNGDGIYVLFEDGGADE